MPFGNDNKKGDCLGDEEATGTVPPGKQL